MFSRKVGGPLNRLVNSCLGTVEAEEKNTKQLYLQYMFLYQHVY